MEPKKIPKNDMQYGNFKEHLEWICASSQDCNLFHHCTIDTKVEMNDWKKKYFGTGCLNFNYTLIADSSL